MSLPFPDSLIASSLSFGISTTVYAPLERVKLLLQCQSEIRKQRQMTQNYSGVRDCIKKIYKTEGLRSFWRGNLIHVLSHFPSQGFTFLTKELIKSYLPNRNLLTNFLSGSLAGLVVHSSVYSFHFVRTRLACDIKTKNGYQFNRAIDVYRKIAKSDGILGFYRGFTISCIGIVVYRGLYFGLYDSFRPLFVNKNNLALQLLANFLLGWSVTLIAKSMVYPFDTVKRRMMMTSGTKQHYYNFLDCAAQMLRKEGLKCFYRGMSVEVFGCIAGAFWLVGFDIFKSMI